MAAEFWKTSPRLLNWALHAASGIVIAIVAVELIPEALGTLAGWWIAVAFAAGGLAYMALEWLTERLQPRAAGGGNRSEERRVGKECVSRCRSRGSPSI